MVEYFVRTKTELEYKRASLHGFCWINKGLNYLHRIIISDIEGYALILIF